MVTPSGYKRWYVAVYTGENAHEMRRYLRSGCGGGFLDSLDLASWFGSRGAALDALHEENMDAKQFDCVQLTVECGAIVERKVAWV